MTGTKYSVEKSDMRGLTKEEAERSRAEHGSNVLSKKKKKSFAARFLSNLGDPIIKILLAALAVNLFFAFQDCFHNMCINYFQAIQN